ncbi:MULTISPECIES: hypothetical protein [Halobacillus]|uniref:hypothetical protein n=1 Tax=Halobacillus TaxID=45667 RepID=UPI0009A7F83C|nr:MULTISPECIES: hypothetical protein [Halobacillus]
MVKLSFETFMGEKILTDRKREKGILYKDFQSLPETQKEHWAHTYGKPVPSLRKKVMQNRSETGIDISKYKLERHMLNNGASLKEVKALENVSMPDLTEQVLKMKRGASEVQFAGNAMLEGMFDLFGVNQHKALERYQSQIHEIETEEGNQQRRKTQQINRAFDEGRHP